MALSAPKTCTRSGCPGLVTNGRCSNCGKDRKRWQPSQNRDERLSAAARGYDSRWRKVRRMILSKSPLCVDCYRQQIVTEASEVHHIKAIRDGGTNEESNLMPLCKPCHSTRTRRGE
jgi:5-methylcytosine-specific restriction protein A